ncbi:MAG: HD domain-containing protein [Candidatus Gastranaerophilales bacterium]|nr:HD domain-containing protein [Candidatus Gastranaerophilales bacterium]
MNLENDFVINRLRQTGCKIYLVGGTVRDFLTGKINHDKDIIICGRSACEFAKEFADNNNASFIVLDKINNIYRVVMEDKINYVDITNPVNNSLEEDIKRRDLTINSLAMDLTTGEITDLLSGRKDIEAGIIRAVSEKNIIDDPLRIMRAYRFASVLGFKIEDNTGKILKKHAGLMSIPAVERINTEILKLFGGKDAGKILLEMDKNGLIDILFPVMIDVKKVPSNTHHHLDLFHHSIETVKQIQNIYENGLSELRSHLDCVDFGGETRLAHLKLAGFLHDIGKFSTWTIEGERHRFIKHDEVGADIAKTMLLKQKFSKKQIEYICFIIRNHIYPSAVISSPAVNDKIYMRYIRRAGDCALDLITIAKADRLSARGIEVSDEMVGNNISGLEKLEQYYIDIKPSLRPLPKLLSGNEIMELRGLKPSRELGGLIKKLHEAQLDGIVQTKEDAIRYIQLDKS